jgi:RND family efflux transporter MFP subunit
VEATGSPLDRQPHAGGTSRWRWLLLVGTAAAICGAYYAGRSARPADHAEAGARRVLFYVDPMHPSYRSDRPGKAPDCGMNLVPVYEDAAAELEASGPGTVSLTPGQEQAANLQTETVQLTPVPAAFHTAGRVTPDEKLTYRVSAGADGWVRHVFSDQTGTQVKRGTRLSSFVARDVTAPQQAYLFALESYERLKGGPTPPADQLTLATQQLTATRDTLQFLGMGEAQIEELGRTRREIVDIDVTAPEDGQILERHVAVGQRFMRGDLLYRIANLERVWVLADIHAGDIARLGDIRSARIRIDGTPALEAKAAPAPPAFDEQGRTGRLRLDVANPRGLLRPGMIVDVELEAPGRPVATVHADAVIDSGATKRVFVATGHGRYELRDVETGWQQGNRVEIRSGLSAGERVVTAGAFLLDSESRMKPSAVKPGAGRGETGVRPPTPPATNRP